MNELHELALTKRIIADVRAGFDLHLNPADPLKVTQTKVAQLQVFDAIERRLKEQEENVYG